VSVRASAVRARMSRESHCGGRKLIRCAMLVTSLLTLGVVGGIVTT
jgi:hypothetical protein